MTEGTIINIMESKRCKGETNCYGTFFNQIYGNQLWKKLYEKEKGARIKHTCIGKKKKKMHLSVVTNQCQENGS